MPFPDIVRDNVWHIKWSAAGSVVNGFTKIKLLYSLQQGDSVIKYISEDA